MRDRMNSKKNLQFFFLIFTHLFIWLCRVLAAIHGVLVASLSTFCFGPWAQLPCGMWDLSSHTMDQTDIAYIARQIRNLWTTREAPPAEEFFMVVRPPNFSLLWVLTSRAAWAPRGGGGPEGQRTCDPPYPRPTNQLHHPSVPTCSHVPSPLTLSTCAHVVHVTECSGLLLPWESMDGEARWRLDSSPFSLVYMMGSSTVFVWREGLCKTVTGVIDAACWRGWL